VRRQNKEGEFSRAAAYGVGSGRTQSVAIVCGTATLWGAKNLRCAVGEGITAFDQRTSGNAKGRHTQRGRNRSKQ
jgi:hypothetical protein